MEIVGLGLSGHEVVMRGRCIQGRSCDWYKADSTALGLPIPKHVAGANPHQLRTAWSVCNTRCSEKEPESSRDSAYQGFANNQNPQYNARRLMEARRLRVEVH